MTNAARRYKKFLRILEEWPLDSLKEDRDLGAVIRAQVIEKFRHGEHSRIESPEKCDRISASLARISSNKYKNMYPRKINNGSTGASLVYLRSYTSTERAIKDFGYEKDEKSTVDL